MGPKQWFLLLGLVREHDHLEPRHSSRFESNNIIQTYTLRHRRYPSVNYVSPELYKIVV